VAAVKVATWNVNSVRAREERLAAWLAKHQPDVLCLQELKVRDAELPQAALEAAGYHVAAFGQPTYNGVAILSKTPLTDVRRGLDDDVDDPAARLVSARVGGLRVVSAYVPNGQVMGSEKAAYKIEWLRRLRSYLERTASATEPLVVCGDFNVARDDLDVAFPERWRASVLFHDDMRAALDHAMAWGLFDLFRAHHPEGRVYSWWDYRKLSFPKGDGLRIDYVFANAALADRCTSAAIDRDERKGKQPSDHAPVVVELDL
jgi:exodeoxyribonuclease-3